MNAQERKELEDAVDCFTGEYEINWPMDVKYHQDKLVSLARSVLSGEYVRVSSEAELASIIHKTVYGKEMDEHNATRNLEIYAVAAAIVERMKKGEAK